jgi:HK97 gp10 family phage protein
VPAKLTVNRFPLIRRQLRPRSLAGTRKIAEEIADRARQRAPVKTGALRDAIHVRDTPAGHAVVAGDSDAFYGHFVEFGTAGGGRGQPPQPPRPFLIPAVEEARLGAEATVAASLRGL